MTCKQVKTIDTWEVTFLYGYQAANMDKWHCVIGKITFK